jgi:hypothetical protein
MNTFAGLTKYLLGGIFISAFAYVAITHGTETANLATAIGNSVSGFTRTLYGR